MVGFMKKKLILSACVAVAMTFCLPSHAQRLIPGQRGFEVVGSLPILREKSSLLRIISVLAYRLPVT